LCNILICIQDSKKNKNKNKNKLLTKTKKIELKQIVFKFIINLDYISLRNSFARFYNLATKSLRNSKLLTILLSNNIINFSFTFVCALLTYIFIKDKEHKDIYK